MKKRLSEINEMPKITVIQEILHGVNNSININYLNGNSIVVTDEKKFFLWYKKIFKVRYSLINFPEKEDIDILRIIMDNSVSLRS